MKNEVFGRRYDYVGNNEFQYGGMPAGLYEKLHFDLENGGSVKLTITSERQKGRKNTAIYTKV